MTTFTDDIEHCGAEHLNLEEIHLYKESQCHTLLLLLKKEPRMQTNENYHKMHWATHHSTVLNAQSNEV